MDSNTKISNEETSINQVFSKTITIDASSSVVWAILTTPVLMNRWMSETDLDIITTWEPGSPIRIKGNIYKKPFENTGKIISCVPGQILEYTHLSSLSRLNDVPENHTTISFSLSASGDKTNLTLNITNFPTETIYRHLAFYWNVAVEILKKLAESESRKD